MKDYEFSDNKILQSWHKNAGEWVNVIDRAAIPSRELITNRAIIEAILAHNPTNVLDVGCGEGWLARNLAAKNIDVYGIDAVAELITEAQHRSGNYQQFLTTSYEDLDTKALGQKFDLVVCNFSLIGESATEVFFQKAGSLLNPGGHLLVQTLHPLISCGEQDYTDGWRPGTWEGIEGNFEEAAPWYFRTISSWVDLFTQNNLVLLSLKEPLNPTTGLPASLILCGRLTTTL
ncbi:class I SAM-dependent methyltransferase [Microbulbifer sp. MLAF003]|uniref:class I SAM-dependent methyltransferase n=1 Tax=Microbulbifer sp. MLAF003 TaxID=3032582 RepID=UPI0024AD6755|nr:class I SAM-dependent methyltransferase [Microbulbifer sp. MLAF003]WHI50302.1 class I SAM-dependent methyltransferase [Microbulbifer sp. MLAF003]